MDDYSKGQIRSSKISPEELERRQKKFLENLESLREEEKETVEKFGIEIKGNIFIDHLNEEFGFKENLRRFLLELSQTEEKLSTVKGKFEETEVNQSLSMLRILREKARTLFANTQER